MKKAGASYHDKARVVKMMNTHSPEQISMIVSLRIEHVNAIINQARAGTLKMMGPNGLRPFKVPGKSDYVQAEAGQQEAVEQRVAEHEVAEHARQTEEALNARIEESQDALDEKDAEIEALKAQLAAQKAPAKKAPRRKAKAKAA